MKIDYNDPMYVDIKQRVLDIEDISKVYQGVFEVILNKSNEGVKVLLLIKIQPNTQPQPNINNLTEYIIDTYGAYKVDYIISSDIIGGLIAYYEGYN